MVRFRVGVDVTDSFSELKEILAGLVKQDVLVGIPQENSQTRNTGKINNAELLYVQTHGARKLSMRQKMQKDMDEGKSYSEAYELYLRSHGSPLMHIPPRPVIEPAIEANQEALGRQYGKVIKAALNGDGVLREIELGNLGQKAEGFVKRWFEDGRNNWPPLAEATIEARKKKGNSQSGIIPLVDTGQLRKSITYVIRDKG